MNDFAASDYEPTAAEIEEFLTWRFSEDAEPEAHGTLTIVPALEHLIWKFPVYWGHRTVNEDGSINLSWYVPRRTCRAADEYRPFG